MPKLCGACNVEMTKSQYAKRQWNLPDDENGNPVRRCKECYAANMPLLDIARNWVNDNTGSNNNNSQKNGTMVRVDSNDSGSGGSMRSVPNSSLQRAASQNTSQNTLTDDDDNNNAGGGESKHNNSQDKIMNGHHHNDSTPPAKELAQDASTPAKSNRSDRRVSSDRPIKGRRSEGGPVNYEVQAKLLNKELKKYENMTKRLRAELRITKDDCLNYRTKLEEAMEESDQLKEALIEAERDAADNSSLGSRSDGGDPNFFRTDRIISAEKYDPDKYDREKLVVVSRKTKDQTEEALGFLQDQVTDMERELEKMRTKLGKSAEDLEAAENRAAQKDKDMLGLMTSLGDIHKSNQDNFEAANRARVVAEEKVADSEREIQMSRSVNSKLTLENIALRENADQLQSRLDVTMNEASELSRNIAVTNSELNSIRTQLQIEVELRVRSEQKERDERGERVSMSAQMLALSRETAASETRLKEEIEANDATWEQKMQELKDVNQADKEQLSQAKERITRLEGESTSLKHALLKASGVEEENQQKIVEIADLRGEIQVMEEKIKQMTEDKAQADEANQKTIASLEESIRGFQKERRIMHNTIQELRGNVRVFARVRPFLPNDNVPDDAEPSVAAKGEQSLTIRNEKDEEHKFSYDRVFPASISQEAVFSEVSEFVQSALDGYNVCLFSYGQTGSGKTHTMQGSGKDHMRGIIPRAIEQIGRYKKSLENDGWQYSVSVSFLEIYNETIRDLLRDEGTEEMKHEVKVGSDGRRFVSDITMKVIEPSNSTAIDHILSVAATNRSVASTDMNEVSSRSHSVFTLHLKATNTQHKQNLRGTLNLVDLAGSERLKRSGVSGDMLKEAMAINKSLSSLTDVFVAIGKKSSHVPFRNSKLTYLLQPSLSGDGKTLMVVNLSPTEESAQESLCSLRFAAQVNKCELGQAKRSVEDIPSSSGGGPTPSKRKDQTEERSSSPTAAPLSSTTTNDEKTTSSSENKLASDFSKVKVVSPEPKSSSIKSIRSPSGTASSATKSSSTTSTIRKKAVGVSGVKSSTSSSKIVPKKKVVTNPAMSKTSRSENRDALRKPLRKTRPKSLG